VAAQNASSPIDTTSSQFKVPKLSISGKTYALTPPAPGTIETEIKPVPKPTPGTSSAADKPVPASTPGDVQSEIEAVKAENAAVREMLRTMEANQKALLEQVDKLQKRLDGGTATAVLPAGDIDPLSASVSSIPPAGTTTTVTQPGAPIGKQPAMERYQDGIIIWKTPNDALIPFLLKFNDDTQLRYMNSMAGDDTFTDHLGVVRDVHARNDITVNRSMFNINGYMFSPRLGYSLKVWTSAGAASIVVAGNISWTFSRKLTLVAGYTGLPGSRSLVATFPFFQAIDRSMADNFFRPGFTQGLWAFGMPLKGLTYQVMVGNGLNTLGVSANKIDTGLALAGSVWWEPLGAFGATGKSANMYDDYTGGKFRIRLGTSFTRSREDRFSNLDVSSPENTALHNSDGVLTFSTGAFAKGVTLQKALYKMWAADWGLKYRGFSVNGQYFARWLSEFEADGPIPETSTFDHGFELTAGHFVVPKKLELYGRGSMVFGQFRNSSEVGGGVRWYFLPTERLWLNGEILRVNHSPYGGAFTPYTAGMNAWVPMIHTVLAF